MHCDLTSATVVGGILHCGYDCYVIPKAQAAALSSIGADARNAYAGLNIQDPASVKQVNAALQKAHTERVAYAKAHSIKLNTKRETHKIQMDGVEKKAADKKQ